MRSILRACCFIVCVAQVVEHGSHRTGWCKCGAYHEPPNGALGLAP
jgi:hypothetical protein